MQDRIRLISTIMRRDQMFDYGDLPTDIAALVESKDTDQTKDQVLISLLRTMSKNSRSDKMPGVILGAIAELRSAGIDYPELAGIEKSVKAG